MSTQNPIRVGSKPDQAHPESFVEVLVALQHERGLPPSRMLQTVRTAAQRVDAALDGVDLSDLPLHRIDLDVFSALERERMALFPVEAGGHVFTCQSDVVEAVEDICNGTDLGRYAYDIAGRAFEIQVDVALRRCQEHDREVQG